MQSEGAIQTTAAGAADLHSRRLVHALHQSILIDYLAGTNPIYVGWAEPGAAQTDPVWRICKLTYDGNNNPTTILWANGSIAYNYQWSLRADPSITYS